VEAAGDGGTTLTGADGRYNDGAFRAKISPPFLRYGAPALAVPHSSNWAVLRLLVRKIDRRECAAFSRSVYNSERSAGKRGWARRKLKTVRPGATTRERFLEGEGEKAFWCRGWATSGGCRVIHYRFGVDCIASASAISSVNDVSRAFASDLETFKLGFRKPLSIKPMYVGCKLAFSASDSWDNSFAFLCFLSTSAKASDISKRRI